MRKIGVGVDGKVRKRGYFSDDVISLFLIEDACMTL